MMGGPPVALDEADYDDLTDEDIADLVARIEKHLFNGEGNTMQKSICFIYFVFLGFVVSTAMAQVSGIAANMQRVTEATDAVQSPQYRGVVEVLLRSAATFAAKDIKGHMATITPQSPAREQTRGLSQFLFELDLKLDIVISEFEILPSSTDKLVRVRCIQRTTKIGGSARFMDNDLTAIHTVVKTDDGWKILGTKILSIHNI